MIVGEGAQAGDIVELDAAIPEGDQGALTQLAQDAVQVKCGQPERIGQQVLVQRASIAALGGEPRQLQAQTQLEQEMRGAHQRAAAADVDQMLNRQRIAAPKRGSC